MVPETVLAICVWANPGADPYRGHGMGKVEAALNNYKFPYPVKQELLRKIRRIDNDAVLTINSRGYSATGGEARNLRDMHFGKNRLCNGAVDTSKWEPGREETALIYCSGTYCVAIPIVCGNISRVDFYPVPPKPKPTPEWAKPPKLRPPTPIPEPSTLLLSILGIAVIMRGRHAIQRHERPRP